MPSAALQASQLVLAAISECDARADDRVYRVGNEDLAGSGMAHHAGCRVHGDPADVVTAELDLASMEARPDFDTEGCTASLIWRRSESRELVRRRWP